MVFGFRKQHPVLDNRTATGVDPRIKELNRVIEEQLQTIDRLTRQRNAALRKLDALRLQTPRRTHGEQPDANDREAGGRAA